MRESGAPCRALPRLCRMVVVACARPTTPPRVSRGYLVRFGVLSTILLCGGGGGGGGVAGPKLGTSEAAAIAIAPPSRATNNLEREEEDDEKRTARSGQPQHTRQRVGKALMSGFITGKAHTEEEKEETPCVVHPRRRVSSHLLSPIPGPPSHVEPSRCVEPRRFERASAAARHHSRPRPESAPPSFSLFILRLGAPRAF